jgi:hypothetical protein
LDRAFDAFVFHGVVVFWLLVGGWSIRIWPSVPAPLEAAPVSGGQAKTMKPRRAMGTAAANAAQGYHHKGKRPYLASRFSRADSTAEK